MLQARYRVRGVGIPKLFRLVLIFTGDSSVVRSVVDVVWAQVVTQGCLHLLVEC
jgi:hypothetical protein